MMAMKGTEAKVVGLVGERTERDAKERPGHHEVALRGHSSRR